MHNFNFPGETNTKAPKIVCINNSIPRKAAPHSVKQRPRGLFCVFISFHPGHARPASKRPKTNKCSFECARPSVSSGCLLSFPANPLALLASACLPPTGLEFVGFNESDQHRRQDHHRGKLISFAENQKRCTN